MAVEGLRRPAWAEISKSALRSNLAVLRQVVGPVAICGVVKANAYGHGAVDTAQILVDAGVDGLAVAIVDEGIELRDAGISLPILLLAEVPPETLNDALVYALTLTCGSVDGAKAIVKAASEVGGRHSVHVKVDTGMHRMGVPIDQFEEVLDILATAGTVVVEGLYTHLASSSSKDPDEVAFCAKQLALFEDAIAIANKKGVHPAVLHAGNSGGAIGLAASRFNMVRVGLALYGYVPDAWLTSVLKENNLSLRPVMSLRAEVSAVRHLPAGEKPSYGRLRALPQASNVATVPFGYADGFQRRLFEAGAQVLINGHRYPLAGAVTMDQIVVDCGSDAVKLGDPVTLLGVVGDESISAQDWADWAKTITWEILCDVGARVPRIVTP